MPNSTAAMKPSRNEYRFRRTRFGILTGYTCRKKLLKPCSARPRGVSSCGCRNTERQVALRWSRARRPRSSVATARSGSSTSWSDTRDLQCMDHGQGARRATVDAEPAADAEVLVGQQGRLPFTTDAGRVRPRDHDAIRRTDVHAQTAENAELG